ncbi:MAG: minor capsid protein, partial [Oscillospiraceae bacterium]
SAAFASAGQKDCFLELGVEKYRLVETLDSETCPLCGELDGKVFKMSEYVVGVTAPPFHPWCRGCTCPHFDDMVGERLARDAEGKHYKVADNLGFKDWKAKVVTEPALAKELFSYKAQLRAFDVKSYKGIWRDDVTTLDYAAKKAAIPMKREYFETAISNANGTAKASFEAHLVDLNDFEVNGKAYYALKDKIKSVEQAFTKLPTHGIMKENPYTIERKDAAYWFTDKAEADSILRPRTGEMWKVLTPDERSAAYDYTAGSGKFNRPLRGYDGYWSDKYYKGPGRVSLDNEGAGAQIKHLTEVLDSSSYDFDIWLQRGVENSRGASSFLGITKDQLEGSTLEQLQELLLDKVVKDEAFVSTAAAKGAGFSGYVFNVYAPRGAKMLYAEPFSSFGGGCTFGAWDGVAPQSDFGSEFEVIIQRGYSFRITKIQQTAGQFFFDVDLIID